MVLRTADSAVGYLPILFEDNADFLSTLPGLPEDAWRKTLELAHERKLAVFGPRPPRMTLADAIAAGQDGFHSLGRAAARPGLLGRRDAAALDVEAVATLARAKKPIVPLLHASALRLEDQDDDPSRQALTGLLAPGYEAWWRAELAQRKPFLAPERRSLGEVVLARQARALRALFDAGAELLPGSGAPQPWLLPGMALHQELLQWTRAGLPPAAVLECATRRAAEALGLSGERGTLQTGAWADILVLDQDASEDLARLLDPAWVIVRGRPVARAELEARLKALGEREAGLRAQPATPIELEPPPQAEGGALILEGTVENSSLGLRLSTERYRVVRMPDDVLLFTARVFYPRGPQSDERELTLEQFVRKGRLEQAHAVLKEGGSTLELDGLWTANSWRMQSHLDGKLVSSPASFREQPVCIDASSVTSLLMLGQLPAGVVLSVVELHPGFDAELVHWGQGVDKDGVQRVRTQIGFKAFRLDETGALEFAASQVGTGVVETRKLSASAFGGAGLPMPPEKLRPTPVPASSAPEKPGG